MSENLEPYVECPNRDVIFNWVVESVIAERAVENAARRKPNRTCTYLSRSLLLALGRINVLGVFADTSSSPSLILRMNLM